MYNRFYRNNYILNFKHSLLIKEVIELLLLMILSDYIITNFEVTY